MSSCFITMKSNCFHTSRVPLDVIGVSSFEVTMSRWDLYFYYYRSTAKQNRTHVCSIDVNSHGGISLC